jgi:hypothetical protein
MLHDLLPLHLAHSSSPYGHSGIAASQLSVDG